MDFADKKFLNLQSDYLRLAPRMASQPRPALHASVESIRGKLDGRQQGLGASWRRAVWQAIGSLAVFTCALSGLNGFQHRPAPGAATARLAAAAPAPSANS